MILQTVLALTWNFLKFKAKVKAKSHLLAATGYNAPVNKQSYQYFDHLSGRLGQIASYGVNNLTTDCHLSCSKATITSYISM